MDLTLPCRSTGSALGLRSSGGCRPPGENLGAFGLTEPGGGSDAGGTLLSRF